MTLDHPDYEAIEGIEALVALYGPALCFHEAEVLRVELLRGRPDHGEARLVLDIHLFAYAPPLPGERCFQEVNPSVARLVFDNIQDLDLGGFNHQNAVMDVNISSLQPPENGARFRVNIPEAFGLSASFTCYRIWVDSLRPGPPPDTTYA